MRILTAGLGPYSVACGSLHSNIENHGALQAAGCRGTGVMRTSLEVRRECGCDGRVRILIASAPHRDTFGYSMPPPGLLRLGGALVRAGVEVELEDLAYRVAAGELPADDGLAEAAARRLLASHARARCDAIGLSVMGATLPIVATWLASSRRSD